MKIETTFDCGDKAWVFDGERTKIVTIGMVRAEHTDSAGVDQDGIQYDNYKPQKDRKEQYMCIETGVGSGSVYTWGKDIFRTDEECSAANAKRIESNNAERKRHRDAETRSFLAKEADLRRQLAKIEEIKANIGQTP